MGWTGYYPTHFSSGGVINRKAECDAYFTESLNKGWYNLVKSSMVGSTYYAAVQRLKRYVHDANGQMIQDANGDYVVENIPIADLETIAVVFLTQVEKGMFYYKNMSETSGPCEHACPPSILKVLSPTNDEYAKEWRKRCWEYHSRINPSKLPIGTTIRFDWNGQDMWLHKCSPNHQFKTPWWKVDGDYKYFSKRRIPEKFEIIQMGGK